MREKSSCARLNLRTLKYRKCLISLSNYLTVYHKKYAFFFSFLRCFTHLLLVSDRYILPVTLLSVVINIPRFFEVNPVESFVIIIILLSEVNPAWAFLLLFLGVPGNTHIQHYNRGKHYGARGRNLLRRDRVTNGPGLHPVKKLHKKEPDLMAALEKWKLFRQMPELRNVLNCPINCEPSNSHALLDHPPFPPV